MLPKILSPVSESPIYPYIELYESKLFGVRARIANRNITVANIVHWYYNEGERVEKISNKDMDRVFASYSNFEFESEQLPQSKQRRLRQR